MDKVIQNLAEGQVVEDKITGDLRKALEDFGDGMEKLQIEEIVREFQDIKNDEGLYSKREWLNKLFLFADPKGQGPFGSKAIKIFCKEYFGMDIDFPSPGDRAAVEGKISGDRIYVDEIDNIIKRARRKKEKKEYLSDTESLMLDLEKQGRIETIKQKALKYLQDWKNRHQGEDLLAGRTVYVIQPGVSAEYGPMQGFIAVCNNSSEK